MKRSMWTGALFLACGLTIGPAVTAFGQQQPGGAQGNDQGPTGQARVRTREGPRIELKPSQRPVIVAVFTNPRQQQDSLEVVALVPAGDDASQAREVVFESRNATENGIVTHRMEQAPGGSGDKPQHLTFTARRGGQQAQIQELAGGNNLRVLAIRKAEPQQQQQQQVTQQNPAGQPGQGQQQGEQAQTPEQQAQQQKAQAEQQAQQAAARQEAEKAEAAREQNDAIIFVYLQGENR
jgi:hypothetical protein